MVVTSVHGWHRERDWAYSKQLKLIGSWRHMTLHEQNRPKIGCLHMCWSLYCHIKLWLLKLTLILLEEQVCEIRSNQVFSSIKTCWPLRNILNVTKLTCRSQTLTWPPRQPDARIWFEEGWKAIHHGDRGCPDNVFTFLPVFRSVTYTLWFPWVEATFFLRQKKIQNTTSCLVHINSELVKQKICNGL
jgi:hypothetical protein